MSLFVLHGTWSLADRRFFLWGEDAYRSTHPGRRTAKTSAPRHPYQMQLAELDSLLSGAPTLDRIFLLPSVPDLGPMESPDLSRERSARASGPKSSALSPWKVTGLAIDPADVLALLASLPPASAEYAYGSDLRLWSQAARFTMELLVRERFVPALATERGAACWKLLLTEPADQARLAALAESLPQVCLSLVAPRTSPACHEPPQASVLVTDFLAVTADTQIRSWLESARTEPPAGRPATASVVERWLNALARANPVISATPGLYELGRQLERWAAPVLKKAGQVTTPFRTCLRLEPPGADSPDDVWTLRVMLQAEAEADPSRLVPVPAVWAKLDDAGKEDLLDDLGSAARLFPPLQGLLGIGLPEACALTLVEAYRFLTEAAALLSARDIGVFLPTGIGKADARVRAHVTSPPGAGASMLGLAQLLDVDWEIMLGGKPVKLSELRQLVKQNAPLVRLDGQWVELAPERLAALVSQLEQRAGHITVGDALRLTAGDLEPVGGAELAGLEVDSGVRAVLERLTGTDRLAELPPPRGLAGVLRPYQARGFAWLAFLRTYGFGACLADDMGLGKTIQMIALLLHERAAGLTTAPTLLICPTSLVSNWQRELARFGPDLRLLVHHGTDRRRGEEFADAARSHDVVISTYALSIRDLADLATVVWAGIVLDEAQNIKNADTRQSQSLRSLPAGYRIALTGTPVENRLTELWSLMDFLNPGYLGSAKEFQTRFVIPIERHRNETVAARLRSIMQPFILRRVKTDPSIISDLPEKLEQPVYVNLTDEQAGLYAAVVDDMLRKIEKADGLQRRGLVLATLTRLKQVCNHPAQFLGDESRLDDRSGKLNRLMDMLEEVLAEGDRALIFTQYAAMGRLLRQHLSAVWNREVLFLHGGVPGPERARMVERFQSPGGPPVFVLTLKAGGVGLNLTGANHVFHFDRWWNPAVENQATDRAFRIGQQRNVLVHKLIAAGTVEEKIDALIAGKRQLVDRVVATGEGALTELTTAELRTLFTLDRE
ncbi:MAG TPA: DEAD/DEAH box helicase [Symbiobacteriaceae bacterium]